jgi:hypothetical protein
MMLQTTRRTKMRKLPKMIATLGFLGVMSVPAALEAQMPQSREGFWFNVGLGYGSLGCQDCAGREGGLSGGLALGGTLSRKVLLGVGTNSWYKDQDGVRLTASTATATVRFYPSATGGFYLMGGLGLGVIDVAVAGLGSASETGAGAVLGLGYDVRVSRNMSLTPYWNGVGISNSDGDMNFGQIGLGLTIH